VAAVAVAAALSVAADAFQFSGTAAVAARAGIAIRRDRSGKTVSVATRAGVPAVVAWTFIILSGAYPVAAASAAIADHGAGVVTAVAVKFTGLAAVIAFFHFFGLCGN
jgi:hypothetical protein